MYIDTNVAKVIVFLAMAKVVVTKVIVLAFRGPFSEKIFLKNDPLEVKFNDKSIARIAET